MAKETVQAVRQAELNAIQKERDAHAQRETIVSEASLNAKALITSMTKQAVEKADQDLSEALRKGNERLEAAKLKAEKEVLLMKEMASAKEEAAINLVLRGVIQGN